MNSQHKHHGRINGGGIWRRSHKTVAMGMIMGVCIAGYVIGPPLYWLLSNAYTTAAVPCPPCHCDCSLQPLISLPNGLNGTSFIDCMEHDSELSGGSERNLTKQLVEELGVREGEVQEIQQRADQKLLEAKKSTSQYQKEAEKCTSGMETCEEAREKAEAALQAQRGVTSMWELRARHKGWKENLFSGANIQSVKAALEGEATTMAAAVTDL